MKSHPYLTAFFILALGHGLHAQNFDFRNTKWGMDTTLVKKSEKSKPAFSKKNNLVFNVKLGELDSRVVYDFNSSDQLYRASYIITSGNAISKNPVYYVNNFLMLQELLTQKYKQPYTISSSTINGKIVKQEEWAANLISDNLTLETRWKTDKTDITLMLFSINDELCLEIIYNSIESAVKEHNEANKLQMIKDL